MGAGDEDDNDNRASVADLKKRFNKKAKIAETRAKKLNLKPKNGMKKLKTGGEERSSERLSEEKSSGRLAEPACQTSSNQSESNVGSKFDVNDSATVAKNGLGAQEDDDSGEVRKSTRVNNFEFYVSSRDYQLKGDCVKNGEEGLTNGDTDQGDESTKHLIWGGSLVNNGRRHLALQLGRKISEILSESVLVFAFPKKDTMSMAEDQQAQREKTEDKDRQKKTDEGEENVQKED